MRKVEYSEYSQIPPSEAGLTKKYELKVSGQGAFMHFRLDYEEFENGVGTYSTAIIRLDDGTIKNIPIEHVRFLDKGGLNHD